MKRHPNTPWPHRFALAACVLFFSMGQLFLPLLGVEDDEELFGSAFLPPHGIEWAYLGHSRIPIELSGYIGALKAWIYRPIFALFGTGVWSQREPMLLAGAAGIWLFFLLLRRIAGDRAAVVGTGLLAVDSVYLLTVCYDWGPVALQHLLLLGGMVLVLRFYQEGGLRPLAGGFFLFGLALWDKTLAVWMLSAMGVAGVTVFGASIRRVVTARRAAVAILAFGLGASPLLVYNASHHARELRDQVGFGARGVLGKGRVLVNTMLGSQLFGWLVQEDGQNLQPAAPRNLLSKASLAVSGLAHRPRLSLLLPAFALALALAALARGPELRAIVFCLVTMAVQWIQMAVTIGAGAKAHHAILLWPLPELVIGVSFACASRRLGPKAIRVLAGVLALLMCAGALQINEYYRMAWRNGGGTYWSNGIYRLSDCMKHVHAERVYCTDWGIMDPLRVLDHDALPLDLIKVWQPSGSPPGAYLVSTAGAGLENADPQDWESPGMKRILAAVGRPDHLFLAHTQAWEVYKGANAELVKLAWNAGYRQERLAEVPDSFGRPVYELYHFVRK